MKKFIQFFFALSLIIFLCSVNQYPQMVIKDTLSGHVYAAGGNDTSQTAIAGANVSLHTFSMLGDSTLYQATTDSTGSFIMGGITPGQYVLICSANGYSTLVLREFNVEDANQTINLFLHDTASVMGGIVSGMVRFDEADQFDFSHVFVHNAIIEFINTNNTSPNIFDTTNAFGFYRTKVPAGQYYVSCTVALTDSTTFHEYYQNAATIALAKVVSVSDGQMTDDIDFTIPSQAAVSHTITFSGNVQSSSNTPLDSATVSILLSGDNEDHGDLSHGRNGFVASTKTDASGNFTITLDSVSQSLNAFIVAAHKDGYKFQFYNNQDTFFKANVLFAFHDTTFSNLNFTLSPEDTNRYSISGTVKDSSGMGIKNAFVTAFDSATGHHHMAVSDSNGNYSINGLAQGSYYLLFTAHGYQSQFYPNASTWETATAVNVSSSITGINVVLAQDTSTMATGGGDIIGDVHSSNDSALAGVLITVKDSHGNVVGTAVTDVNGSYSIAGLVQGSYTITASFSTYTSQQQTTTYSPSSGSTQVSSFTLPQSTTAITTQPNNLPTRFALDNNYPNPFNPSTIIGFSIPYSTHVTLEVYNVLGQKVAQLVNGNLAAGHYAYSFNANNLSSGVYLYRIQTDKFVSVKKMLLTK